MGMVISVPAPQAAGKTEVVLSQQEAEPGSGGPGTQG